MLLYVSPPVSHRCRVVEFDTLARAGRKAMEFRRPAAHVGAQLHRLDGRDRTARHHHRDRNRALDGGRLRMLTPVGAGKSFVDMGGDRGATFPIRLVRCYRSCVARFPVIHLTRHVRHESTCERFVGARRSQQPVMPIVVRRIAPNFSSCSRVISFECSSFASSRTSAEMASRFGFGPFHRCARRVAVASRVAVARHSDVVVVVRR